MELEDLEKTIRPLFEFWKKNIIEEDFGDFINNQKESLIINLLDAVE